MSSLELADGQTLDTVKSAVDTNTNNISNDLKVVQVVYNDSQAVVTGTAQIPADDTIPQNTEGLAVPDLDTVITPKDTNNSLIIVANLYMSPQGSGRTMVAALFKDSDANALAATVINLNIGNKVSAVTLQHQLPATIGVSAITFKIRFGSEVSELIGFNGQRDGTRYFSTTPKSSMVIYEVAP